MNKQLVDDNGVHCVVDGQYGSTGKGVLAAWIAENNDEWWHGTISNAGPNSGHTFYHNGEKHVLKQLPTFAVKKYLMGHNDTNVYLSAGAVIDPQILAYEAQKYPDIKIVVHPMAAVITQDDKESEHGGTIAAVAGTRSGTGAVLARKVARDPSAVFQWFYMRNFGFFPSNVEMHDWTQGRVNPAENRYFMEVSQGFSLGVNSQFYPKVTSRECTVMQGIADARIAPRYVARTYLSMRTFPIRVGNVDGFSSGDIYPDQKELSWEELGQIPELTTVTQRVRRVFTFSEMQAMDAIAANAPDFVFVNFMNYLTEDQQRGMMETIDRVRDNSNVWFDTLYGFGPKSEDVKWG